MSAKDTDVVRIPIEIKTKDIEEIQNLLNEINEAESNLKGLRPRKGRGKDSTSRSPITREEPFEGGIFKRFSETEALPAKGRDRTSKQAFSRENEFNKLRDQVKTLEGGQSNIMGVMGSMGQALGLSGVAQSLQNPSGNTKGSIIKTGAETASAGLSIAKGGAGGIAGRLGSIAGRAFLPIAILYSITEVVRLFVEEMFRPGGWFDRRYRRIIKDEVASLTDRAEKAEIQQGIRIIRVTPVAGFRGPGTTIPAQRYKEYNQMFLNDFNMESRTKGLFD